MKDVKIINFEKRENYYAEYGRYGSHYLINNLVGLPDKTNLVVMNSTHITTPRLEEIDIVSEYMTSTSIPPLNIVDCCKFMINNKFKYCPHAFVTVELGNDKYEILFAYDNVSEGGIEEGYMLINGEFVRCVNIPDLPYDKSTWNEREFTENECHILATVLYDSIDYIFLPLTKSLRETIHDNIKAWYVKDTPYEIYDYDKFVISYTEKYGYDVHFSIENGKSCAISESGDYEVIFTKSFAEIVCKEMPKTK